MWIITFLWTWTGYLLVVDKTSQLSASSWASGNIFSKKQQLINNNWENSRWINRHWKQPSVAAPVVSLLLWHETYRRLSELSCCNEISPRVLSWTFLKSHFRILHTHTHTHTHTHACLFAAELNLITGHVHKSSEDTVTLTVLFTSSGLCLCPAFWENGCELPLSAWSGPCVCTPLFSHLSAQAFVVCRLVSLKLTHHGGLLTRLVSWGSVLEASCVVAFSWEAADKKKKKKKKGPEPLRSWHSAADGHLSSSLTVKPPADFTELCTCDCERVCVCVCVCLSCFFAEAGDRHAGLSFSGFFFVYVVSPEVSFRATC